MAAHRLGIAREPVRQFGGIERHRHAAAARRRARADSVPAPSPGSPGGGVGRDEILSFHEMIS